MTDENDRSAGGPVEPKDNGTARGKEEKELFIPMPANLIIFPTATIRVDIHVNSPEEAKAAADAFAKRLREIMETRG